MWYDVEDMTDQLRTTHNAGASRYELYSGGKLVGIADYDAEDERLVMTHTQIDPQLRGRGLGEKLVAAALDDIRTRGLTVKPVCSFVAGFIRDHPEYGDLVA